MTPTEQAARWLADVPRRDPNWNREVMHIFKDGDWIGYADALAAIARHLAPGDDLVERLLAPCQNEHTYDADKEEAAARISALIATVAEVTQERDRYKMACDSQGKVVVDVAGTMDKISPAQMEAMSAILLNPMICASEARAEAAEAEAATMRERVARLEGALDAIRELNMTGADENGHQWANSDLIEQEIVASIGEGGKHE